MLRAVQGDRPYWRQRHAVSDGRNGGLRLLVGGTALVGVPVDSRTQPVGWLKPAPHPVPLRPDAGFVPT